MTRRKPAAREAALASNASRVLNLHQSRVVLVELGAPASRLAVVTLALVAASALLVRVLAPAVAVALANGAMTIGHLEAALAWSGEPDLRRRLAWAYAARLETGDLARSREDLAAALRARPAHARTWLDLTRLADQEGASARARESLHQALRLGSHDPDVRWEAALLRLRWGERERALADVWKVIALDPDRRESALAIGRALLAAGEPLADLLPEEAASLTEILEAAVQQGDLGVADAAWRRRELLEPAIGDELRRGFVEALLRAGKGRRARMIWLTAPTVRALAPAPGELVWNGGFEAEPQASWGFDWRVAGAAGVEADVDQTVAARGRRSLRLTFRALPDLEFAGVAQWVAVEPGRRYRLGALARALDLDTRSGLRLEVVTPGAQSVLARTGAVAGTTDWRPLAADIDVPLGLELVEVRFRREPALGPEANLVGRVWVDEVSVRLSDRSGQK